MKTEFNYRIFNKGLKSRKYKFNMFKIQVFDFSEFQKSKPASFISKRFWEERPATFDSMTGEPELNEIDINHTKKFLSDIPNISSKKYALEIGAGVGRITFQALYQYFEIIDILERNPRFIEVAKHLESKQTNKKIRNYFCSPLETFNFKKFQFNQKICSKNNNGKDHDVRYDLVFIQWILEYLNDEELGNFFADLKNVINKDTEIVIKENINDETSNTIFIEYEGSFIRTIKKYEEIFEKNKYKIITSEMVSVDRKDLYQIKCWRLKSLN